MLQSLKMALRHFRQHMWAGARDSCQPISFLGLGPKFHCLILSKLPHTNATALAQLVHQGIYQVKNLHHSSPCPGESFSCHCETHTSNSHLAIFLQIRPRNRDSIWHILAPMISSPSHALSIYPHSFPHVQLSSHACTETAWQESCTYGQTA